MIGLGMNVQAYVAPSIQAIVTSPPTEWRELCSCVLYMRSLGHDVYGNALNVPSNTTTPSVGDLALFTYPNGKGHVAFVEQVLQDGISVSETNFKNCQWTRRFVEFDNYALRGYRTP